MPALSYCRVQKLSGFFQRFVQKFQPSRLIAVAQRIVDCNHGGIESFEPCLIFPIDQARGSDKGERITPRGRKQCHRHTKRARCRLDNMRAWLQFPGSFSPIKDKTRRHQLHQRECRRNKIARKPRKAGRFKSAEIVSVKFHLPAHPHH